MGQVTTAAQVQTLARELPHAKGLAKKKKERKKEKKGIQVRMGYLCTILSGLVSKHQVQFCSRDKHIINVLIGL